MGLSIPERTLVLSREVERDGGCGWDEQLDLVETRSVSTPSRRVTGVGVAIPRKLGPVLLHRPGQLLAVRWQQFWSQEHASEAQSEQILQLCAMNGSSRTRVG